MENFIKIKTLFSKESERNFNHLTRYYSDPIFLRDLLLAIQDFFIDRKINIKQKKILLKPNWVLHDRNPDDSICLRTNDSFLLAALEVVLEQKPKSVIIGDAPIQGCNWEKMLSAEFIEKINKLSAEFNIPVLIKDFRRVTFDPELNNPVKERKPISDYVIFDLGQESHLEPISSNKNIFRVTNYNPDRLGESHKRGVHKYCITKDLFNADIVISIPKVKTHQKTGITCALKNIVGLNGDKDYLPHHRIGGSGFGGDCYPGNNLLRLSSEYLLDCANRHQGKFLYKPFIFASSVLWKLSMPEKVHDLAAGWYGNDTTWRMVMDLNKIAIYGKFDGTIATTPQRQLFSLCDGIIGGQGDGPLRPQPLPLGIISFTNHSGLNDICMATLMGFDYHKIPLLENQNVDPASDSFKIYLNGNRISIQELSKTAIKTAPPPGWENYF